MKNFLLILSVTLFVACSELRVKRYGDLLDPLLGSGSIAEVNRVLGKPTSCEALSLGKRCEYRTAAARNYTIPDAHRQLPGFGPDLSPYQYFDVLSVVYDHFGVFREWEPVAILQ